jgi:hypothetical protein
MTMSDADCRSSHSAERFYPARTPNPARTDPWRAKDPFFEVTGQRTVARSSALGRCNRVRRQGRPRHVCSRYIMKTYFFGI